MRLFGKVMMNISYDINLCFKLFQSLLWRKDEYKDDFFVLMQNALIKVLISVKSHEAKNTKSDGRIKISFKNFLPKDCWEEKEIKFFAS